MEVRMENNKELPEKLRTEAPICQTGSLKGSSFFFSMLTLDPITLFYHDLREASRGQLDNPLDDVADWAAKVPAKGLRRIGTITPTPTLASGSEGTQRSSAMATSLVSSRSASGGKVGVRSTASGLSDANEEHSKEPEDVSKGKRKGRASSSVRWLILFS